MLLIKPADRLGRLKHSVTSRFYFWRKVSCDSLNEKRETMENTIAIASLQIGYQQKTVVKNINLTVRPGEILGMLGPSGSGKTTLIRAIMGMIKPMSGTVRVFGQAMPNRHLLEKIGYMGQTDALYDALTARENLQFFASLRKMTRQQTAVEIKRVVRVVRLQSFLDRRVADFSGGMKRRLSLAITLLGTSELLILDEPTVGIAPELRIQIWQELKQLAAAGKTILMTTHVMEDAEQATQLLMIRNGEAIAASTPLDLKQQYVVDNVEEVFVNHHRLKSMACGQTPQY
jgi:ABC-2 type transport system ATP-binding protein